MRSLASAADEYAQPLHDALRDVAAISTPGAVGLGRDSFHDGLHQYLFIMMTSLQC